jgi:hypothetical protein
VTWDGRRPLQVHSGGFLADPVFRAQLVDLGVPLPDGKSRPDVRRRAVSRTRSFLAR